MDSGQFKIDPTSGYSKSFVTSLAPWFLWYTREIKIWCVFYIVYIGRAQEGELCERNLKKRLWSLHVCGSFALVPFASDRSVNIAKLKPHNLWAVWSKRRAGAIPWIMAPLTRLELRRGSARGARPVCFLLFLILNYLFLSLFESSSLPFSSFLHLSFSFNSSSYSSLHFVMCVYVCFVHPFAVFWRVLSVGESRQPWAGVCLGPIVFFF